MTQATTTRNNLTKKMASRACLAAAVAASSRGGGVSAFSASSVVGRNGQRALSSAVNNNLFSTGTSNKYVTKSRIPSVVAPPPPSRSFQLSMSSTVAATASTTSPRRVKTADAEVSDEQVSIKGWVRTVRKQKTLAFVEVNDGSNMSGIQCVLPFDGVDEDTMKGKRDVMISIFHLH
jgi:hypothetical protein